MAGLVRELRFKIRVLGFRITVRIFLGLRLGLRFRMRVGLGGVT